MIKQKYIFQAVYRATVYLIRTQEHTLLLEAFSVKFLEFKVSRLA